jgi:FixJ family two-component response regulator
VVGFLIAAIAARLHCTRRTVERHRAKLAAA